MIENKNRYHLAVGKIDEARTSSSESLEDTILVSIIYYGQEAD